MIRWDATGGMRLKIISENISSATRNVFTLIISNKERKKTNITIYKKCYIEPSYKSRDTEVKAEETNWKQIKKPKETLRLFWEFLHQYECERHKTLSSDLQSFSVCHGFIQVLTVIFNIRCVVTQPAVVYRWCYVVWHRSWSRYPSSSALDCSDSHMSPDVGHMYKHTTSAQ